MTFYFFYYLFEKELLLGEPWSSCRYIKVDL